MNEEELIGYLEGTLSAIAKINKGNITEHIACDGLAVYQNYRSGQEKP